MQAFLTAHSSIIYNSPHQQHEFVVILLLNPQTQSAVTEDLILIFIDASVGECKKWCLLVGFCNNNTVG